MRRRLIRLSRMRGPELHFRLKSLLRVTAGRLRHRLAPPTWERRDLARILATTAATAPIVNALREGRWPDAHAALAACLCDGARPFPIEPAAARARAARIRARFPSAAADAAALAQPLVEGRHRLLGFPALEFGQPPDWHFDPVHQRRSPMTFWADVPYLEPSIGDHKIIWELNRHQHWIVLGRAAWLTGERRYRDLVLAELADWLDANPPLTGINWASMLELGFRCLSWTWAAHFFAEGSGTDERPWLVDLLLALDRQLTHIEHNLSYYFSPNTHLTGEALALFVCGHAFPELAASQRRIALGRAVLAAQTQAQIGPDGGHRERSTHYHRYTLDFYVLALTIARLADDPAIPAFTDTVARLATAARLLADDTGRIPHIGDDDGGVLFPICGGPADVIDDALAAAAALTGRAELSLPTPPEETFWLLDNPALQMRIDGTTPATVSPASQSLPETGYFVMRAPGGAHIVINAGRHGYMNGGHAHADALALTLSLPGQPLLVDSGTGTYTTDPALRDWFRSTPAHNTLVVDERSQSEAAGPFHWRRVADATSTRWVTRDRFDYFEGVHAGYLPAVHRRRILSLHRDLVIVADLLESTASHRVDVYWHIDPAWQVTAGPGVIRLASGAHQVQMASTAEAIEQWVGDGATRLGWHSPAYGRLEPLTTLRFTGRPHAPAWICTAFGLDAANPITAIEHTSLAGAAACGLRCRIRRTRGCDEVVFMAPTDTGADRRWRTETLEGDAEVTFRRVDDDSRLERLIVIEGTEVDVTGAHRVHVRSARREPGMELTRRLMYGDAPSSSLETLSLETFDIAGATSDVQVRVDKPNRGRADAVRMPLAGVR